MSYWIEKKDDKIEIRIPARRKWYLFLTGFVVVFSAMIGWVFSFVLTFKAREIASCIEAVVFLTVFTATSVSFLNAYFYMCKGYEVLHIDLKLKIVSFYRQGFGKFNKLKVLCDRIDSCIMHSTFPRTTVPSVLAYGLAGGPLKVVDKKVVGRDAWYDFGVELSKSEADDLLLLVKSLSIDSERKREKVVEDFKGDLNSLDMVEFRMLDRLFLFLYVFLPYADSDREYSTLYLWTLLLTLKFVAFMYLLKYFFFPDFCVKISGACLFCNFFIVFSALLFGGAIYRTYLRDNKFEVLANSFYSLADIGREKRVVLLVGVFYLLLSLTFVSLMIYFLS